MTAPLDTVGIVAWAVTFVVVVVTVTGLSRRAGWSAPIVLVAVGVGAAFIPAVPRLELQPDVVLVGVLPALLFASAIRTSFIEVRARGDSIITLSVGLVIFSTFAVGLVTWLLVPDLSPVVAIAFGAIVAPTDAVSVAALVGSRRLPRRLTTLLEGEGLLNDATALVALNLALAAITAPIGVGQIFGDFAISVVGGVASGVLVAVVLSVIRRRLRAPVLDTSLSLVTPYIAFLPAYAVGGSGFLAVAIAGLWLGYRAPFVQSAEARIAERINWRTVSFLLENAVFLLIGLQLPDIVESLGTSGITLGSGILICLGVFAGMLAARFVWVFGATVIYRHGPARLRERRWSWRTAVAVAFSGIRGVVTLAAVFLLPTDGIPQLGFLQLLAFVMVVGSLLQALAIGPLVQLLRLPSPSADQDRMQIRSLTAEVQASALDRLEREAGPDDPDGLVSSLRQSAEYRVEVGTVTDDGSAAAPDAYSRLRLLMLQSERDAVLQARREGRYEEAAVIAVLADFDSIEAALKRSLRRDLPEATPPSLARLTQRLRRRDPGQK